MSVTADPRRIEFARSDVAALARDVSLAQRVSTLERRIFTGTAPLDPLPGSIPGTAIAPGTTPGDIFNPGAQVPGTVFGPGTVPGNVVIPGTLRTNHFYADDAWITLLAAHSISSDYLYVGVEDAKLINTEHLRAGSVDADRMTFDVAMGNKVLANLQVAQDIETDGLSAVSGSFGTMTAGKAVFTGASGAKLGLGSTLQYTPPGGPVTTFDGILAADSTGAVTLKFDIATGNLEVRGDIKSGSTGLGNIAGQIHGAANVQPNTIPGDKLTIDAIGVRELNGVEINALELDVTSANVGNLKVGSVDFMTITGPTVQTSAANPRVVMDPGGIRAFDASGNTTVQIAAGDGSFTATRGTITGATFRTAGSGPRVEISAGAQNAVTNSGFEFDTTGWITTTPGDVLINPGATLARTTAQANTGVASGQVDAGSRYLGAATLTAPPGGFLAGVTYNAKVWLRGDVGGETVLVLIGGSGFGVSTPATLTTSWQQITLPWTPGANTANAYVGVRNDATGAARWYIDDVDVQAGSGAPGLFSVAPDASNPFYLHADTGVLELRNVHFVDLAGAQENIEWYSAGSRFSWISATHSGVFGNRMTLWSQGSSASGYDPSVQLGSIYTDSGGTARYIYVETNQNQVTANARGVGARLIDYAGQSSFLQLAGGAAAQQIARGRINVGPGSGAQSATATVSHGLLDVNGNPKTPTEVQLTAGFGAWTTVNADNYTSTTFQISGWVVAGNSGIWPAGGIDVAWEAIG